MTVKSYFRSWAACALLALQCGVFYGSSSNEYEFQRSSGSSGGVGRSMWAQVVIVVAVVAVVAVCCLRGRG